MDAKLFFSECDDLYSDLQKVLIELEFSYKTDPIAMHERSLIEIDEVVRKLKSKAVSYKFSSLADEVYFFREIKPLFISQFIYHTRLLLIEVAKPNAGKIVLKDYYDYEILSLKNFYEHNREFYEYYRRRAAYLDFKYFVRNQFDVKTKIESALYDLDEKFRTSHDHLISQIIANDRLEVFLLKKIEGLDDRIAENLSMKRDQLTWTASKSSLVELLYSLHLTHSFNGGNIELSEIVKSVEKSLNIDLGNFYKTISEIKNRKNEKTKFLHLLTENLDRNLEED